ncbi:MAG TPA: hypothetical protein DCK76_11055 [Desulfotomaculum sp.]|nr:MAG: Copper amine oxidase-like domain-containing protein [Desulfotomaculum sp. 46_80]HAG11884.1 hypothetical protein [Desulfotomaculum sp.]HBY02997.1 hypothetical protein [Desulfotomaculum sp.]
MKKKIVAVLLILCVLLLVTLTAEAASTGQTNISQVVKLIVNGKTINTAASESPVVYKGRTFVPIRIVAEALNLKVDWDSKLKTVKITGKTDSEADSSLLAQKDKTIQDLTAQLTQKNSTIQSMQAEIDTLKKQNNTDLGDLEDDLFSDYDYLENVKIDEIRLDGDEDDVTVKIEVNLDSYDTKWSKLSDSEIKSYIKNVVDKIQDELSDDTKVSGKIIDNDSNDTLVTFTKNGTSTFSLSYKDEDYRGDLESDIEDVEDNLEGDNFWVDDIEFEINTVTYYDDDTVKVVLGAVTSSAASKWDDLTSSKIESGVKAIGKEVADTFEDDADVSIDYVQLTFKDNDNSTLTDGSYKYNVNSKSLTKI